MRLPRRRHGGTVLQMITATLVTTDRRSYRAAARLLVQLRGACAAAGMLTEFGEFMTATTATNRRRPTCISELVRVGLIRADLSVVPARVPVAALPVAGVGNPRAPSTE